jgi:hypothetical protein
MEPEMKPLGALLFMAATLAAIGPTSAQRYPFEAAPIYDQPYDPCQPGYSVQSQDRAAYDCSGTRGRIGLGASPFHPEGPGNVVSPGR